MSTNSSAVTSSPSSAASFVSQPFLVRRAAVLGAGTMGSRIAAHLANAGIPVLLLDMVPANPDKSDKPENGTGQGRNRLAIAAIEALGKTKPAAFYEASLAALVTPGNFEDDLAKLANCDWVIEAVAENLAIKVDLLNRVVLPSGAECDSDHEHFRAADCADRGGSFCASRALLRNAFFQPSALYAAA